MVAVPDDVSFVFRLSFCESAEPAADLLLGAVEALRNVFDDAVAALDDVVLPAMGTSDSTGGDDAAARTG